MESNVFFLSYHFFGCGVRVTRQISITVTLWILFRGVYFHCIYLTVSFLKMSSNYGLLCLKKSADFFYLFHLCMRNTICGSGHDSVPSFSGSHLPRSQFFCISFPGINQMRRTHEINCLWSHITTRLDFLHRRWITSLRFHSSSSYLSRIKVRVVAGLRKLKTFFHCPRASLVEKPNSFWFWLVL